MPFDKKGFLGKEAEANRARIVAANKELFDLCAEANSIVHDSKSQLQIHNEDVQELMLGCSLIKLLNIFQGVVMLSSYGLIIEAKVLLRALLEILFISKICCTDKSFINEYIKSDQAYRLKLLKSAKKTPEGWFDSFTDDMMKQIKEDIDNSDIREYRVSELAERAGLKYHYDTAYRLLSNTAHSGARSLEDYLVLDEKNNVRMLNFGPIEKDMPLVLITAVDTLCMGAFYIFEFFKIDKAKTIEDIRKRNLNIGNTKHDD